MWSLTKVAERAGICSRTLSRDIAKGTGPRVQYVGRAAIIEEAEAVAYIERRRPA